MPKRLQEAKLENLILGDPKSHADRLCQLGMSTRTMGTSGHFVLQCTSALLLECVKIICNEDLASAFQPIGSGRFGACYLHTFCHYQVCVKQVKCKDSSYCNSVFIHEANILSKYSHVNLLYLFGVCLSCRPSLS